MQAFIDDELAETTYDPRYLGHYNDRFFEPGNIDSIYAEAELATAKGIVPKKNVESIFTPQLKNLWVQHKARLDERKLLVDWASGQKKPPGKGVRFRGKRFQKADLKLLIEQVDKELANDRADFAAVDRELVLAHFQMAMLMRDSSAKQLRSRCNFHVQLTGMIASLRTAGDNLDLALRSLPPDQKAPPAHFQFVLDTANKAQEKLDAQLKMASGMTMPNLNNMQDVGKLDAFLLGKTLVKKINPNATTIEGKKIVRIFEQLSAVITRAERLQAKSLGGILALQEEIARMWKERQLKGK